MSDNDTISWLQGEVTTCAWCWKLTLTDGTVMAFTSHDVDLTIDGITYLAATGFSPTSVDTNSDMSVDNMEVDGFLSSDTITEDDVMAGRYDFAEVVIFICNWSNLNDPIRIIRQGMLGQVTTGKNTFQAEIRGLMQMFQQSTGEYFQKHCRATLGDRFCKKTSSVNFDGAVLTNADFTDAYLPYGSFQGTVLSGVTFGTFHYARFVNAKMDHITSPSLYVSDWYVADCDMSYGTFTGLSFNNSSVKRTNMSGMNIGGFIGYCTFENCNLSDSNLGQTSINGTTFKNSLLQRNTDVNGFFDPSTVFNNCDITAFDFTNAAVIMTHFIGCKLGNNNFDKIANYGSYMPVFSGSYSPIEITYGCKIPEYVVRYPATPSPVTYNGAMLIGKDFRYKNLAGSVFDSCNLQGCDFTGACLDGANFTNSYLDSCVFTSVHAVGAIFNCSFNAGGVMSYQGTVTAVNADGSFTTDVSASTGEFDYGLLTFLSGANENTTCEVKHFDNSTFTLFLPAAYPVEVGTKILAHPGCDGNFSTCRDRFNNVLNFRGEPYIPGNDFQSSYPSTSSGNVS